MGERERRVAAAGILSALAGAAVAPAQGQGSDTALVHLSLAVLYDASVFAQSTASERQVGDIANAGQLRLTRFYVNGVVKARHPWRYVVALDYNRLMRERVHTVSIDEIAVIVPIGRGMELSVGRQVEGVTQQVVESSRTLALTERPAALTAFIPPKDNGVRLLGGSARHGRWSIGWFNPEIATAGRTASGAHEFAGRMFFAPTGEREGRRLFQLGGSFRWKGAPDGSLRFRTRPETNGAPYYPDTRSFAARGATTGGIELLVQRGAISMVTEALLTGAARRDSATLGFPGYYVEATWRPGGESHVYDARNGALGRVELRDGRPALELAGRVSHVDLASRDVDGGVFTRASAAISWRTAHPLVVQLEYGDATLERAGTSGHSRLVTARVQWELR